MPPMGRRPTINTNCPPGMRPRRQKSGKIYYYLDTGQKPRKEIPLGSDYVLAVKKWSELQQTAIPAQATITFKMVWNRYLQDVLVNMPAGTQKDYLKSSKQLLKFFNDPPAPLEAIEALHVKQYMDRRGKESPTRANRERSLMSTLWNHARGWGYTNQVNPCAGVKPFKENKRTIYVEDNVAKAVYDQADQPTRDAIDLGYLTAQRPGDVIKMYETDISNGGLLVTQGKGGAKIRIAIVGTLKVVIDRILKRKEPFKVRSLRLILDEHGNPLSQHAIWKRFDKARDAAAIAHPNLKAEIDAYQIRDLRAKGGTDKANDDNDMRAAQKLLGHSSVTMTERYVRQHIGEKVTPNK